MKLFGIRLVLSVILMMLLEIIIINIAGILPFIAVHMADIAHAPFLQFLTGNLLHPIEKSTVMMKEKNPLFFLGSTAVVLLPLYISFIAKGSKGKYKLADRYAVHGSSRFAHKHEVFKSGEIVAVPVKQLMRDLEASMFDLEGEK